MASLLRIFRALSSIVRFFGRVGAWLAAALMLVIVLDVTLRRWFVIGSTALQELEWHLHGVLFLLVMAWAYMKDSHIRIELLSEKLSTRTRVWTEFWGILAILLPYVAALLYFGVDYVGLSWAYGEASASPTGLGARYIIKAIMVFGFLLLGLAGIARALEAWLFLFGSADIKKKTRYVAAVEHS